MKRHWVLILGLYLLATVMLVGADNAAASTVNYLRPTGTISSSAPWSVVGASSAWQALDDNVTELETPTSTDYISANVSHSEAKTTEVSLPRIGSLAGIANISATAWFFTPTAASVELRVVNSAHSVTSKSFSSTGWHSLAVPVTQSYLEDGELSLRFKTGTSSGVRKVYAATLKVSYDVASPTVYWGAWMDGDVYAEEVEEPLGDAPWDDTTWDLFEEHAKKAVSIVHFGQPAPWSETFHEGPLALAKARGAIPLMDMGSNGATLSEIGNKEKDSWLRTWTNAVSNYEYPFFFRWDWEMNGTWYAWGKEAAKSPETFVKAWRRFHDIAEEEGATNITWVWCPNVIFTGTTELKALYPGDSYVDWTCMDGYNHGANPIDPLPSHPGPGAVSFRPLFEATYNSLLTIAPNKPIMIGETASSEYNSSKSGWIQEALAIDLPSSFPKIKAINWFNWNHPDESGETELRWDWPIESSLASQNAFADGIGSSYYASNSFGSLPVLTSIFPLP